MTAHKQLPKGIPRQAQDVKNTWVADGRPTLSVLEHYEKSISIIREKHGIEKIYFAYSIDDLQLAVNKALEGNQILEFMICVVETRNKSFIDLKVTIHPQGRN